MAHRHQSEINIAKPSTRDEFPWVRYVAPDQKDRPSMLYTLGHESSKRMVWLIIPCKLLRKDRLRLFGLLLGLVYYCDDG